MIGGGHWWSGRVCCSEGGVEERGARARRSRSCE
uniref:Uncharacterized protein n=1 Tax=Arundo donax TaxID=35708 RepID=A0A0A9C4Y4_ARUDO